jgi:CRP-like cAMP-binding protein
MSHATHATVRAVPWLKPLGEDAIDEVIEAGHIVRLPAGATLVRELEVGESLYLLLRGEADVTVMAGPSGTVWLKTLGPGDAVGEMSLLTGELRSATVTARKELEVLAIEKLELDELLARHPSIAVHFAREIGARLVDADRALDALLESRPADAQRLSGQTTAVTPVRGSFRRAWRELVATRQKEPAFLALVSFLVALTTVRLAVWAMARSGADLFGVLRAAYTSGIVLLVVSVATSLMRFSPAARKAIAVGYGAGFALLFNELSVFLAFDVFWLDMTTRDRDMVFSVEALYRRSESQWALVLALGVLLQVTYLRRFYRRSLFILATRLQALFARGQ